MQKDKDITAKPGSDVGGRISREANPVGPQSSGLGGLVVGLVILAVLGGGAYWWFNRPKAAGQGQAQGQMPPGGGKKGGGRGDMPVPVVAGTVARKDVPVYLDGLGTVQAYNMVTVRSRVDGELKQVAFTEGQEVKAGDLLAQIDPDPFRATLEQATAKKGQDEALLANAKVDLERYAELLKKEGVTQQVYDTQKAQVNQLEAAVKADQAAIESAKVQLAYTRIVSPIDGRVGIRQVDQGNIVRASDPNTNGLVTISQMRPISLIFTLPEQYLPSIHREAPTGAGLKVLAVDRDNTTVLGEGKLAVVDNLIDVATGTIRCKATFPNEDKRLWPGQFVNARLLLTVRTNSAVVPASVVQRGAEGTYAFLIKEDQTVEMRPVKVGQTAQGEAIIEEGLQPGEQVVVDGQFKLQKGSKVRLGGAGDGGAKGPLGEGPGSKGGKGGKREGGKGPGADEGNHAGKSKS